MKYKAKARKGGRGQGSGEGMGGMGALGVGWTRWLSKSSGLLKTETPM